MLSAKRALRGRPWFRIGFAVALIGSVVSMRPAGAGDRAALGLSYDTGWAHDENSGPGFTYFSGRTFVDCANTRVGYRQSADIFTGGYTHDRDGAVVSYADMGILFESDDLRPGEVARPNKVQLYGQARTGSSPQLLRFSGRGDAPQSRVNVVCDTPLTLTFYIASASEIDVRYDGRFVSKRGEGRAFDGSVTARIVGFVPGDGWGPGCASCAIRRVDTLAVGSGDATRPGAYFGIRDRNGVREPTNTWWRCVEGRYAAGDPSSALSYRLSPFRARPSDVVDSPDNARTTPASRPAFLIRGEGTPEETIGLDQR